MLIALWTPVIKGSSTSLIGDCYGSVIGIPIDQLGQQFKSLSYSHLVNIILLKIVLVSVTDPRSLL